MCFNVDAPSRDLNREATETLQSQLQLQPEIYRNDAIYQPLYSLLNQQNMERTLLGFQGGYLPTNAAGEFTGGIQNMPGYQRPAPVQYRLPTGNMNGAPTGGGGPVPYSQTGQFPPDSTARHEMSSVYYPSQGGGYGTDPLDPSSASIAPGTIVTRGNTGLYNAYDSYRWTGDGWERGRVQSGDGGTFLPSGDNVFLDTLPEGYTYDGPGSGTHQGGGTGGVPTGGTGGNAAYVPSQMGLLELFESYVAPTMTNIETQTNRARREADIADVQALGGGLREAFNTANPEQAALMAQLNTLAGEGLNAGLTDYETRAAQQAARQAQSARGFGYGSNDAFDEAMRLALDTQQRREANRQFGLQVAGANQAFSVDPLLALTGRTSQGGAAAMGGAAGGFYRPPAGTMFDPFNAYAGDLYSSNQNAAAYSSAASANANSGFWGSVIEGVGSAIGCWVAREVFGNDNPKWVLFRTWLEHDAPRWFRALYLKHGPAVAAWLHEHPAFKPPVRAWMEWIIVRNLRRIAGHWHTIQPA